MAKRQLPPRPSLEHLKNEAKALLKSARADEAEALTRVAPYFSQSEKVGLKQIQLVIAREYGFDSWNKLTTYVTSHAPAYRDHHARAQLLYCSFCGRSQHEVRKLIAGPSVFICNDCIASCNVLGEGGDEVHRGLKRSLVSSVAEACDFCGKPDSEPSAPMVAFQGPTIRICQQCVGLCNDILEDESDDAPA